ncbi:MAG: RNA polymerase subunit sigma, partial [Propionibacteriales bacterium]
MAIRNTAETEGIEGKDSVGLYLSEIARTPLLTAQEEVELAKQIEAGLLAKEILAGAAPNNVGATTEELEILAAEGEAATQRFISANLRFSTYATWWVRQAITRGIAQQARIVRLPVHVAEQINQVSAARHSLSRLLGREPDASEIADELGIELSRVLDLESIAREHLSLDAPLDTDSETSLG